LKWATPAAGTLTFVGCSLNDTGDQTISNNTNTAVTWNTEDFDTDAFHSTSSNTSRITIPAGKAGKYQINAFAQWDAGTTGSRQFLIYKNGSLVKKTFLEPNNQYPSSIIMLILDLAVSDYIELFCYQSNGGNQVLYKSGNPSQFSVGYLGA
jgi:hypothetical protein